MLDFVAYQVACRTRALTLSVLSTGSITLSVTATGFARAAGSFITDGFAVGMEIASSGFTNAANNGIGIVTGVSALALTVSMYTITVVNGVPTLTRPAQVVEGAAAARTLSVGLPSQRSFEGSSFTAAAGIPYVDEQFLPGPNGQVTIGPLGDIEAFPMWILRLNLPQNSGILADGKYANAILNLFAPRTAMPLSSGDILRVRHDTAPYAGQRLPAQPGFSMLPVNVPLRIRTSNSI